MQRHSYRNITAWRSVLYCRSHYTDRHSVQLLWQSLKPESLPMVGHVTIWCLRHLGWVTYSSTPARSPASTDQRCQTSSCMDSNGVIHPIEIRVVGAHVCSMQATFSRRRYTIVSRNVRWRTVLLQSSLVAPSSVLRFHQDKIVIMPFVAYVFYNVPKIIKFYECIPLLQAKMTVGLI